MRSRWSGSAKKSRHATPKFSGFDFDPRHSRGRGAFDASVRRVAADPAWIFVGAVPANPVAAVLARVLQRSRPRRRAHHHEFRATFRWADFPRSPGHNRLIRIEPIADLLTGIRSEGV